MWSTTAPYCAIYKCNSMVDIHPIHSYNSNHLDTKWPKLYITILNNAVSCNSPRLGYVCFKCL